LLLLLALLAPRRLNFRSVIQTSKGRKQTQVSAVWLVGSVQACILRNKMKRAESWRMAHHIRQNDIGQACKALGNAASRSQTTSSEVPATVFVFVFVVTAAPSLWLELELSLLLLLLLLAAARFAIVQGEHQKLFVQRLFNIQFSSLLCAATSSAEP
jgi:hypothetical protein